ncbi:MAG: hypothetical protein V4579_06655 [Pseudomonadota bacterium]
MSTRFWFVTIATAMLVFWALSHVVSALPAFLGAMWLSSLPAFLGIIDHGHAKNVVHEQERSSEPAE